MYHCLPVIMQIFTYITVNTFIDILLIAYVFYYFYCLFFLEKEMHTHGLRKFKKFKQCKVYYENLFPILDLSRPPQRNHCYNFPVYPEKCYAHSNIHGLFHTNSGRPDILVCTLLSCLFHLMVLGNHPTKAHMVWTRSFQQLIEYIAWIYRNG